jgi:hypothetical protein
VSAGEMAYLMTHHDYCLDTGSVTTYTKYDAQGYPELRFVHVLNVTETDSDAETCEMETGSAKIPRGFRCSFDKRQGTCASVESQILGWRVAFIVLSSIWVSVCLVSLVCCGGGAYLLHREKLQKARAEEQQRKEGKEGKEGLEVAVVQVRV